MTISLKYKVERNPIIEVYVDDVLVDKILFIGDPHLGRKFSTGVPSHRLGHREEFLFSTFRRMLKPNDPLITKIIIVGDLFDKFIVSPTIVYETFKILSELCPDIDAYLIPGNHDLSKDNTKFSSFKLLTTMLRNSSNVTVIESSKSHPVYYNNAKDILHLYFDCYNPFNDCKIDVDEFEKLKDTGTVISVGHWDSLSILEKGYTPPQELLDMSEIVVSGHEHTYREYSYPKDPNKNKIIFTGSMQPYSHAEDPDKDIYMTVKEQDLSKYDYNKSFQYKCLRIECNPLFVLSAPIDCFSLSFKVIEEVKDETEIETESVDINNYNQTLVDWLEDKEDLSSIIKQELLELLKNKGYLS